ncbi:hypothetical protein O6H91_02G038300 [Diphasiastrum complanatum]|uniref:Uncharacterized protein n=1 Tax=Diphasiastrum complanatum TaxID=34168 RepID=A0ACC2EEF3_DIPCM|nr:hypothetical protein O6H91_02G038300 [Diphasiastrum complanatum]
MQQNVQYGLGYYTQPPVAPDYGQPYPPSLSQLPASAYSSAPSYDPAQNSSEPSYYAAYPYAPQVPSIPVADPSFSSPNSPYMSSNTSYNPQSPMGPPSYYEATYDQPNPQNPMGPPSYEPAYERNNPQNPTGPPSYEAAYERPFDYGRESLPHSISSPALASQPHGSNPTMYRSDSYQDGFAQVGSTGNSPQVTGHADQGSGAFISAQASGYDQRDSAYLQGGGYERSGFEQLGSHGQGNYDNGPQDNYKFGDIYAYDGGQVEPYGSRGTRPIQSSSIFNPLVASGDDAKIARSSPKPDAGGGTGVLKYRVKLLSESNSSDPPTDVICQIGLDGVRMLVPATNKMLRIYPLDTITKWEVSDPSTLTFWAKTSVDVEQRRIRLQSNSYTTSGILDTLTAACVQLCEMVDKETPSEASKGLTSTSGSSEAGSARKSSFADWVTLKSKSASQEEKQHWVPDEAVKKCTSCGSDFGAFIRRHHCRNCGDIFCDKCTRGRTPLTSDQDAQPVRVCDQCLAEVTQRLMNVESNSKPALQRPHEDLAKKLQEEMEKNAARKPTRGSTGSSRPVRSVPTGSSDSFLNGPPHLWSGQPAPEGSGPRMREVACPTCTVHLEVQVPRFGTETVECGVCQHPFLVSAD